MYLCQYFSDVLPLMYVFPYYYSALMALHTVLHVDTVLVAVALMIMTSLGPSPGLGRHICLIENPCKPNNIDWAVFFGFMVLYAHAVNLCFVASCISDVSHAW